VIYGGWHEAGVASNHALLPPEAIAAVRADAGWLGMANRWNPHMSRPSENLATLRQDSLKPALLGFVALDGAAILPQRLARYLDLAPLILSWPLGTERRGTRTSRFGCFNECNMQFATRLMTR